jgi:hypothetical protein
VLCDVTIKRDVKRRNYVNFRNEIKFCRARERERKFFFYLVINSSQAAIYRVAYFIISISELFFRVNLFHFSLSLYTLCIYVYWSSHKLSLPFSLSLSALYGAIHALSFIFRLWKFIHEKVLVFYSIFFIQTRLARNKELWEI